MKSSFLSMLCVFVPKGKLAQVHWVVFPSCGDSKVGVPLGPSRVHMRGTQHLVFPVLSEYLRGPKFQFSIEPLANKYDLTFLSYVLR